MMKLLLILWMVSSLAIPVSALDITAPPVPKSGEGMMPDNTASFAEGILSLLEKALELIRPDIKEASEIAVSLICLILLFSVLQTVSENTTSASRIAGCCAIAVTLLSRTNSMIQLSTQTVQELSDYGKLLCPVMTAAMAAQGGISTSAALYAGTAFFNSLLSSVLVKFLIPAVYLFLALSTANHALGEDLLKRLCDAVKSGSSWFLKTILTVFTTYMSITGVVSGSTDAAALKTAKVTISTIVPVVGGILSDSSEAILVSAGIVKNAAGVYGILAVLAVFLGPFIRIGTYYLLLKLVCVVSGILGTKEMTGLTEDFSTAMGLLLAMTGSVCLLLLLSTVCFMRGFG